MLSVPADQHSFYHKMLEQWSDLTFVTNGHLNKKIEAPTGMHDDHPDADVLALWAGKHGINRGLGGLKPSKARNRIDGTEPSLNENRKTDFDALANRLIEEAPALGRDITKSQEMYDTSILKGDQVSKRRIK